MRYLHRFVVGGDWGTASPSAAILLGVVRDPCPPFRQGDVIAIDERDTAISDTDLATGDGSSISSWAATVREMLAANGVSKRTLVVTDDARGLQSDTVVTEMRSCGLSARRPFRKDRRGTWSLLRGMLASAVQGSERPALWIDPACKHLIQTLPEAPRGANNAEDVDPKWAEDHWLDALGYGLRERHVAAIRGGTTVGTY